MTRGHNRSFYGLFRMTAPVVYIKNNVDHRNVIDDLSPNKEFLLRAKGSNLKNRKLSFQFENI